jgi:hypothetical protein
MAEEFRSGFGRWMCKSCANRTRADYRGKIVVYDLDNAASPGSCAETGGEIARGEKCLTSLTLARELPKLFELAKL